MIVLVLAALCAVSFYLRCGTLHLVFLPDGVNFGETDAWYHVRSIENLVRNFPWRMTVDPYSTLNYQEELATGPFFDYAVATVSWIAGFGHPSEHTIHVVAAWMPAIFGTLIVPVVFLLAREVFGTRAALVAAAAIATMPGHFLSVGSVGYTDHHVLESLLSAAFFWLLLRSLSTGRGAVAGVVLGAYLLTFVGGAFVVAATILWMVYEQIRGRWPSKNSAPAIRPVLIAFSIAFVMVLPFYRTLWMGYTIAALTGGMVIIVAIQWFSARTKSQVAFFATLLAAVAAALLVALKLAPNAFHIVYRLAPSFANRSQGVSELESLFYKNGSFTLRVAWEQIGPTLFLAMAGLILLADLAIRKPDSRRDFLFVWTAVTFFIAAGQIRMTYYLAVATALVSGYLIDSLIRNAPKFHLAVVAAATVLVLVPNISLALDTKPGEMADADWREACLWLRRHTPEPFGDPAHYYERYTRGSPQAGYTVFAWWDYGYWISAIAHRVPVANPTQINASAAAALLLARDESEAAGIMERWKARYLVIDGALPLLSDESITRGKFPNLFPWARELSVDDYYFTASERDANGQLKTRLLYRPAYFQSMMVRLFLFGGHAVEKSSGAAIAYVRDDGTHRQLTALREFPTEESAIAAEAKCRFQGCLIVSTSPIRPCVHLDELRRFHPVFSSQTKVLSIDHGEPRSAVQIYSFE